MDPKHNRPHLGCDLIWFLIVSYRPFSHYNKQLRLFIQNCQRADSTED